MQIVRTFLWVLLAVVMVGFASFNWNPIEVKIWDNLVIESKLPAIVIVSFLLGLVPMWLLHRGVKWRLNRRIKTLENAMQANTMSQKTVAGETDPSKAPEPPTSPNLTSL